MIAHAEFGWILFAVFVFWLLQVLRPAARGPRRPGGMPPGGPARGRPDATQREGAELEQLLRQLERRLGTALPRPTPPVAMGGSRAERPELRSKGGGLKPGSVARVGGTAGSGRVTVGAGEDAPVDRAAQVERIERQRRAEAAARNREISDADYAAFEARIHDAPASAGAAPPALHLSARELRDAFIWREILSAPKAFEE